MKTFKEFSSPEAAQKARSGFPTFEDMLSDGEGKGCLSESTHESLKKVCEDMMAEMGACHGDETERTAESYKAECCGKLQEMMEMMESKCNEYMK